MIVEIKETTEEDESICYELLEEMQDMIFSGPDDPNPPQPEMKEEHMVIDIADSFPDKLKVD